MVVKAPMGRGWASEQGGVIRGYDGRDWARWDVEGSRGCRGVPRGPAWS